MALTLKSPVLATGNPVRSTLANVPSKAYSETGFSEAQPLKLAILGGSRGALALNRGVPTALSKLSGNALGYYCPTSMRSQSLDDSCFRLVFGGSESPRLSTIWPSYTSKADVAICRAGALTVVSSP